MTITAPDRLLRQFALHNRWQQWRTAPAEHLFHLLAALILLLVLGFALLPSLRSGLAGTPDPAQLSIMAALIAGLLALAVRADVRRHWLQIEQGWLAASAWPHAARLRALREAVLLQCGRRVLLLWLVLLAVKVLRESPLPGLVWVLAAAVSVAGLVLALLWTGAGMAPAVSPQVHYQAAARAVPPGSSGLGLLHHAWRTPPLRSQRWQGLVLLLLVPGGLYGIAALAALVLVMAWLWAGRCLRHFRESCFASSRWLAATTLSGRQLLGALLPPLLLCLALVSAYSLLGAWASGASGVWLLLICAVLLALLSINVLLVVVHRHAPARWRMAATIQSLCLLLTAQAAPILLLVLWPLLAGRALAALRQPQVRT